ncbi:MAG: class I SAM-dependent methyltransferase [Nitrospinae bacterium]|nr:class I SAM-dependent methyltransferase [Nitrospinota bacterium]MBI3813150.1 class I SAM-dependent methyltransferase [Nitrospinota bacterium]
MSPDLKFESSFQKEGNPCKEYRDYYSEYNGPIGGDYRFKWICETYFKKAASDNEKVLDIGCGEGTLVRMLAERGYESYGVDASLSGIEHAKKKNIPERIFLSDIETEGVPFPDYLFDCVCCFETIEHLTNPYRAMSEIKRVLKPSGKLLVSIPNPMIGHPLIYPGLFTKRYFKEFLIVNGMKITNIRGWGVIPQLYFIPDRQFILFKIMRRLLHSLYSRYTPVSLSWLWVFEAIMQTQEDMYGKVARDTKPV